MSLDVRPDHLKIVQDILSTLVPDREVWAFGSRVTGKATETSDLDLAIIGDTPLDFETLAALRDAFSASRIPYKVDVVDWATVSEAFRKLITDRKIAIVRRDRIE
ncbi:MAG: nucleotidyltransferase domain-containing protein [Nitrospirae bacterium]|jgi:Nucleotidyltransferase domain.|nr:MAG: DNA polymerase, beta protein [Leptospirillum sp. Group IV 'UBA BS']MCL4486187.1 nucleotidyltransferase domain-containing protein [Nitrospirota bacterium]MCL5285470.1 nucleotidyltransferase domain-containing protein [Nitrospirota bacterium]